MSHANSVVFKPLKAAGFARADVDEFMDTRGEIGTLSEIHRSLADLLILSTLFPTKAPE